MKSDSKVMKTEILIIPTVHNVNECAVINALHDKLDAVEQQLRDIGELDGYLTLTHFNPRKRVINYCDIRVILNRT